jgi:hypothetical protein
MNQSATSLTRAEIESKRSAVEAEIKRFQKIIESKQDELRNYDWALQTFFDLAQKTERKKTALQMVEEVLLNKKNPMTPKEIHVAITKLGYTGAPGNIYPRLFKWMKEGKANIIKISDGLYAHKSFSDQLKSSV